jgi:two-component system, OmpR family, KDP operon response regulator KdpE
MVNQHEPAQVPKILIIEDEPEIRRFLRATLLGSEYRVVESPTGSDGLQKVTDEKPALVLLDLGLPDMDGLSVIRELRGWSNVPIIVLSARGNETDKIKALDGGADDYLTKPFGVGELLARVRVALRRLPDVESEADASPFVLGDLCVDFSRHQIFVGGREVHLTPIEHRLLTTLIRHNGKLVTHRQLLKEVWGPDSVFENHYLRVYMAHLRRKIESDPSRPRYLLTEPGIGYRLAWE